MPWDRLATGSHCSQRNAQVVAVGNWLTLVIVCKKSAVPKTFLRLICSQLYIVWMKYCKYSPFYCERLKHEKVRHSLEIGNVCFQSKSCTLPLQPTHFKWNLYFQTASEFSVIHQCLMSSLLVFAAKFMSAMQATGDPSNLLAIKAIARMFWCSTKYPCALNFAMANHS